ncbi:hypothetical protein DC3_48380 [Deinococcus cellulosilyticus NBRC 106333 = KACC 11606]|uniref:Uncharacterized protein n=2 Tax=Deinococcus cellulosilyticus TaxID=401558 RepID=A0A511N8M3_DEIC1|nr:hypothetical protein DC3_48380 [Deinococcus cellulosilyticus NBRC 106333 = KACC 11606]
MFAGAIAFAKDHSALLNQFWQGKAAGAQRLPSPTELLDMFMWEQGYLKGLPAQAVSLSYPKQKPQSRSLILLGWSGNYKDFIGTEKVTYLGLYEGNKVNYWTIESGPFKSRLLGILDTKQAPGKPTMMSISDLEFMTFNSTSFYIWYAQHKSK